jgi:hypothetical protein
MLASRSEYPEVLHQEVSCCGKVSGDAGIPGEAEPIEVIDT